MIVTRITANTDYPFHWRVSHEDQTFSDEEMFEIEQWTAESAIYALVMPRAIYLPSQQEVTLFLLRFE